MGAKTNKKLLFICNRNVTQGPIVSADFQQGVEILKKKIQLLGGKYV